MTDEKTGESGVMWMKLCQDILFCSASDQDAYLYMKEYYWGELLKVSNFKKVCSTKNDVNLPMFPSLNGKKYNATILKFQWHQFL